MKKFCIYLLINIICLSIGVYSQWVVPLQPFPLKYNLYSNETTLIDLDEYFSGSMIQYSLPTPIEGVSLSSSSRIAKTKSINFKKNKASQIKTKAIKTKAGGLTGAFVTLYDDNTVIYQNNENTIEYKVPKHAIPEHCYDIQPYNEDIIYLDCRKTYYYPPTYIYDGMLYVLEIDGDELKEVNVVETIDGEVPLESRSLYNNPFDSQFEEFLFRYPEWIASSTSNHEDPLIEVWMLTDPLNPKVQTVMDRSYFSIDEGKEFSIMDLTTEDGYLWVIVNSQPIRIINSWGSLYSGYELMTYDEIHSESFNIYNYGSDLMMATFTGHNYTFSYFDVSDVSQTNEVEEIYAGYIYGDILGMESFNEYTAVFYEESPNFSPSPTLVIFSSISNFPVAQIQLNTNKGSVFVDAVSNEVVVFGEEEINYYDVYDANQLLFNEVQESSSFFLIVASYYVSLGFYLDLEIIDVENSITNIANPIIPDNTLVINDVDMAIMEVPVESFFGNDLYFYSNASELNYYDYFNKGVVEVYASSAKSLEFLPFLPSVLQNIDYMGYSILGGSAYIYECIVDGGKYNSDLFCDQMYNIYLEGNIEEIFEAGNSLAVSNELGDNTINYNFYDLWTGVPILSLQNAFDCSPAQILGKNCLVCIAPSPTNTISIYDLDNISTDPIYTINENSFTSSINWSPVKVIGSTSSGNILIVTDLLYNFDIISLLPLATVNQVILLSQGENIKASGEFLMDGNQIYNILDNTVQSYDFSNPQQPMKGVNYNLSGSKKVGASSYISADFIYVLTSEGINKLKRNTITLLDSIVSIIQHTSKFESFCLSINGPDTIVAYNKTSHYNSVIQSNNYYTFTFDYAPFSTYGSKSYQWYYIDASTPYGVQVVTGEAIFQVIAYNNSISVLISNDSNTITTVESYSTLNVQQYFTGDVLYYDFIPFNFTDNGTTMSLTNVLTYNGELFVQSGFESLINSYYQDSTNGLIYGIGPKTLFVWNSTISEDLSVQNIVKIIIDGVAPNDYYVCTDFSMVNEVVGVANCLAGGTSNLVPINFSTDTPTVMNSTNLGVYYESISFSGLNVYAVRINEDAENLNNKEYVDVFQISLTQEEFILDYIGKITGNTDQTSLNIVSLDVLNYNGIDYIFLLDTINIRVYASQESGIPLQIQSFSDSSQLPGYESSLTPLQFLCSTPLPDGEKLDSTCVLAFTTGGFYIFNLVSDNNGLFLLELFQQLPGYGSFYAGNSLQITPQYFTLQVINQTSLNQTLIIYDLSQEILQGNDNGNILAGQQLGALPGASCLVTNGDTAQLYVSSNYQINSWNIGPSAYLSFGNLSNCYSPNVTLAAINDNGINYATLYFNITIPVPPPNTNGIPGWALAIIIIVALLIIIGVGFGINYLISRKKKNDTGDLNEQLNKSPENNPGDKLRGSETTEGNSSLKIEENSVASSGDTKKPQISLPRKAETTNE